ncbi:Valine--tRNA ligase OS=Streptomyces glaucescens OX=1907 GN=valS PE=3 SV=1 [Streptomyces glaucescens]
MTENTQQQPPATTTELPTRYTQAEVEGTLYERWVERGYFEADAKSDKPPFTVVIPPPNITGSLHLGHAFEHTLIDALTRRKRMQGYETLWQPGMDHAGIATQNVVERELAKEGKWRQRVPWPGGLRRARLAVEGRVRRADLRADGGRPR